MLRARGFSKFALGVAIALGLLAALLSRPSEAKVSFDSPYTLSQTYAAALRLVRVDLGLKVLERDPDAGYLLFEYKSSESGRKPSTGSVEMVDTGRAVKVVLQLPAMPRYHEQVLVDALSKKLREEYGEPPERARAGRDAGPETTPGE
jgi:hypothetical protein